MGVRGGGDSFKPGAFRHNGAAALALLPALAAALGFAHQMVAAVGIVGVLSTTILDLSGAKEATFFGVWLTLGLSLAGSALAMMAGLDARARETAVSLEALFTLAAEAQLFALVGFWATVQFKWVQAQHSGATLAMERLLMTASPLVSLIVVTHGLVAAVGSGQAPFYSMGFSILLHGAFLSRPLRSSFAGRHPARRKHSGPGLAVRAGDAKVCTAALFAVPFVLYLVLHSPEVWPAASLAESAPHLWSLLLLLGVPLAWLAVCPSARGDPSGALWWSKSASGDAAVAARFTAANLALIALVLGLEGRVVFRSFSQYVRLPAPWSFLAVTLALGGGGGALLNFLVMFDAAAAMSGEDEDVAAPGAGAGPGLGPPPTWAGAVLLASVTAGCLALGMPNLALAAALACAAGLALFLESLLFRDYLIFVGGLTCAVAWFLRENFWYLDVRAGALGMGEACTHITACWAISALVPGLAACGVGGEKALGSALAAQALVLAYLERGLVFLPRLSRYNEGDLTYPPYLVLVTSALGVAAARALRGSGRIGAGWAWFLQCVHASKVSAVVLHEAHLVVPCAALLMAITAPTQLYDDSRGGAAASSLSAAAGRRVRGVAGRMTAARGAIHAASAVLAVLYSRFAVFDVLSAALDRRPGEALLLGSLIAASALACVPLVRRHFPHSRPARRLLVAAIASGIVVALVAPPLPVSGGSRCPRLPFGLCPRLWDSDHRPEHEVDDVAIYGDLAGRREHWPRWLLVCSVVSGLAGLGGSSVAARLALALCSGAGIGAYVSLEVFPGYAAMQAAVGLATCLCLAVLAVVHAPGLAPAATPAFSALVALLPLSLLLTFAWPPPAPWAEDAASPDPRLHVDAERDAGTDARAGVLVIHCCYALAVAFSAKLRRRRKGRTPVGGGPSASDGAASRIGNVATVEAFLLCLSLFRDAGPLGRAYSVFALCPVLLLLNLSEGRRYAPVAASVPLVLTATAFAEVFAGGTGARGAIGNLLGILVTLPNHLEFVKFLWAGGRRRAGGLGSAQVLIVGTPLNLVAILVTTLDSVRAQALAGIAFATVQYFGERGVRRKGMMVL